MNSNGAALLTNGGGGQGGRGGRFIFKLKSLRAPSVQQLLGLFPQRELEQSPEHIVLGTIQYPSISDLSPLRSSQEVLPLTLTFLAAQVSPLRFDRGNRPNCRDVKAALLPHLVARCVAILTRLFSLKTTKRMLPTTRCVSVLASCLDSSLLLFLLRDGVLSSPRSSG